MCSLTGNNLALWYPLFQQIYLQQISHVLFEFFVGV